MSEQEVCMLALPPYELMDEDVSVSKEEFCLKLAELVADILDSGGRDLEKLEVRWQKGRASFRTLFKTRDNEISQSTTADGQPIVLLASSDSRSLDGVAASAVCL